MKKETTMSNKQWLVNARVQIHPRLDAWMQGDRFGAVSKVTKQKVHVVLDKSMRTIRIAHGDIIEVLP